MDVFDSAQALSFESEHVLARPVELVDCWEREVDGKQLLTLLFSTTGLKGGRRHYLSVYVNGRRMASTLVSSDPEDFAWPPALG